MKKRIEAMNVGVEKNIYPIPLFILMLKQSTVEIIQRVLNRPTITKNKEGVLKE